MNVFTEISLILAVTTLVTMVIKLLKQPLVVGYILSGIIVGPFALNILHSSHDLELFSKIGIVLLLFIVGLHLNPRVIKEVGSVSVLGGVGQVVFTTLVGFLIALLLGLDRVAALYVSIALTFSSTIIILKLLADKRDLQKLYAKIAIGFLLVQDLVATIILIGITVMSNAEGQTATQIIALTVAKGLALFLVLGVVSSYVLPRLTRFLAHSQELLFLFSLSWGIGLGSLFAVLGFSVEIGALIAGVSLSITPYAGEMASRLKPLRDFFIVVFFILLGSQMILSDLASILVPALILSLFVLVGNPIIVIVLMNMLGFNRRTSFMTGMTVAQISEFSLILATLGMQVGHLSQQVLSLITLVALITIAGSTYLILYAEKVYPRLSKLLVVLELLRRKKKERSASAEDYSAVIFGYDRVGQHFVEALAHHDLQYLVVDYNPQSIQRLADKNLPHLFGDASDVEFLDEIPTQKPLLAISSIADLATNLLITRFMLGRNPKAVVIPLANSVQEAHQLYEAGAAFVIMPHHLGAEYAAKIIKQAGTDHQQYVEHKTKHLEKIVKHYAV